MKSKPSQHRLPFSWAAIFAALVLGIFTALAATGAAQAQGYPNRTIRIVVPFPAGGSNDVAARIVAEQLSAAIGQTAYVENKGGANGTLGIADVANSAPDGYSLLVSSDSTVTNFYNFKPAIDPVRELTAIIQIAKQPVVLAAHPSLGASTLAELVTLAKKQPGLQYGTGSGLGSPQSVVAEWFAQLAGIKLEQVPYRGGGPLINDLVGGHIKLATLGAAPAIPFHRSGKLILLAQSGDSRSPGLPDVPTFQEAGFKELALSQWVGVFAPAGLPGPIADKLNAELDKLISSKQVRDALLAAGMDAVGTTRAAFVDVVRSDVEKYGRLKKQLEAK
ncbi:MAG: tripartite tricarboxylate transporter substrate binding protein [Rhabdaerophilum sp.]